MAQQRQRVSHLWHPNPGFIQYGLALFLSIACLSESVAATPARTRAQITQQPASASQEPNRAAAKRAFVEAEQLFKQGTAQSRQQAIQKYEEALQLWRALGDSSKEASTLHGIGLVY